ncbi:MAG: dihydropteroate synthase [Alistipes sp.]|nr:dihydropteroate synthase [Candidatus Alistipes equi]
MAVLNVTDDSFYASSRARTSPQIERRTEDFIRQGASIIDIGGCSTRPGSQPVSFSQEWERVREGILAVRRVSNDITISIDTFRSEIVKRSYDLIGGFIVNDISAMEADENMAQTVLSRALKIVLMHMRGTASTMQSMCHYQDVTKEVKHYLLSRAAILEKEGYSLSDIILDPGFGFAKTTEQNYELLSHLSSISSLGYRVLVGLSRKSMIRSLLGIDVEQALAPTQVLLLKSLEEGASILRVHDVASAVMTIKIYRQLNY